MFRALIGWMDRDWASRKYNPVFAVGQRFIWALPVFASLALISILDALGVPSDSPATLVIFGLGAAGMIAIMLLSLYRWAVGYSRSDFRKGQRRSTERGWQRDRHCSGGGSSGMAANAQLQTFRLRSRMHV